MKFKVGDEVQRNFNISYQPWRDEVGVVERIEGPLYWVRWPKTECLTYGAQHLKFAPFNGLNVMLELL